MQALPAVPLDFLTKLTKSRAVMEAADTIASTKAAENGTGMKNVALAPRGATPALQEQAPAKRRYDPLPDQDIEYLTQLPAGVAEHQVSMGGGNPTRDVHAQPISEGVIAGSGMPDSVKKAMIAFPIDSTPVVPINLPNVNMDLMEQALDNPVPQSQQITEQVQSHTPVAQPQQRQAPAQPQQRQVAQTVNVEMIRKLVNEEMTNRLIKDVRQQAIKDTIATLMKEGIIPAKKK